MKVLLNFTVVPMGVGVSVSHLIAECEQVLAHSGVKYSLHANGTNVEAEWDQAFAAIRRCHERLHELGVPRLATTVYLGTRTDKDQTLEEKVAAVRPQP